MAEKGELETGAVGDDLFGEGGEGGEGVWPVIEEVLELGQEDGKRKGRLGEGGLAFRSDFLDAIA